MTAQILIMIPYPVTVGFAIGRLAQAFYRVAVEVTGSPGNVHFCYTTLNQPRSPDLPADFSNLLACQYNSEDPDSWVPLCEYISKHQITTALALDMPVEAPCLPAIRQAGIRTVVSYWGAPMSSVNTGLKLILKRLEVRYFRRSKPDYFIFESEAMRHLATHGRGISPEQTTVIHTGVNVRRFRPLDPQNHATYERFGIPLDRKIFVYMGHLHRRKGVHVLIDAMVHIVLDMRRSDIHCLFLGNQPNETNEFLEQVIPAANFITFGGYQTNVSGLLPSCYAGVIPSTGWDSFPMSSLEMQACGLPVIASDCQGVPETISPAVTGIVIPAGDAQALARAICGLADNPHDRAAMSTAARKRIESQLTLEHQMKRIQNVLSSFV